MMLLVTKRDAAKSLGVSVRKVDILRQRGELEAVNQGRRVYFPPETLAAYVERLKAGAARGACAPTRTGESPQSNCDAEG